MDSILDTIKDSLGVPLEDTSFDGSLIMQINAALMVTQQLGVGSSTCVLISSKSDKWSALLGDRTDLEAVKLYIYLKVRLSFDPPQNSFLVDAITRQITELESRLNIQAEGGST